MKMLEKTNKTMVMHVLTMMLMNEVEDFGRPGHPGEFCKGNVWIVASAYAVWFNGPC
jgi:hypothetical protein